MCGPPAGVTPRGRPPVRGERSCMWSQQGRTDCRLYRPGFRRRGTSIDGLVGGSLKEPTEQSRAFCGKSPPLNPIRFLSSPRSDRAAQGSRAPAL